MTQEEIEAEAWACIDRISAPTENGEIKLTDLGEIVILFGPVNGQIDGFHFDTDGTPPLHLIAAPRDGGGQTNVYITRVGDISAYEQLPSRSIPQDPAGLPLKVFLEGDSFLQEYTEALPAAASHYEVYREISRHLRPKRIMEIGVRAGYSAWAMLQSSPEATYLGLDADNGKAGGVRGYMDYARAMLRREYPHASIQVECADSQSMLSLPERFDLIHIDGDHHHDEALHDMELCAPYADYILVDDTGAASTVQSAVVEFLSIHPELVGCRYDTWRGLTLIDTRPLKGTSAARYYPEIFDRVDIDIARSMILTMEGKNTTDHRWKHETEWIVDRMEFPPDAKLIDLGCGIGRLSKPLVERGHLVIGVDGSETMLGHANEYVGHAELFAAMTNGAFSEFCASGFRAQGGVAAWVFQHMMVADLEDAVSRIYHALDRGSSFYQLDGYRRVPVFMSNRWLWLRDDYDIPALMERQGFSLYSHEAVPRELIPDGSAVWRHWKK